MKMIDLINQEFGRLTVIKRLPNSGKNIKWECLCICGTRAEVSTTHLRSGHTASCGCIRVETSKLTAENNKKHGMWKSPEFQAWTSMIKRCHSPKHKKFSDYGGRGIHVCATWRASFLAFYQHVGPRPSDKHSIDRIENSKGYETGNVRWAVAEVQNNNKRTNVNVCIGGITKTIAQWSKETGLSYRCISYRVAAGWSEESILAGFER